MYLSLSSSYAGNACAVRDSIKLYKKNLNQMTQFFDWLVVSMKTVNEVLESKSLLLDNYSSKYPNPLNNVTFEFKNYDCLISHHDIKVFDENSINEITSKFNRRHQRLIETIKTEKKINFIRYCKNQQNIEEEEILKFFKIINTVNPNLLFNFVLISDFNDLNIPNTLIRNNNFIYINLNKYIDDNILNEKDDYQKKVKSYKCLFDIVK